MKKILYFLWASLLLAGCDKEPGGSPETEAVSGQISVHAQGQLSDDSQSLPALTRADDPTALNYTFEAWTRDDSPRCVLRKTVTGTLAEASFLITLVPGQYDFLFWADYGKGYYRTDDLRHVTLVEENYQPGNDRDAFACVLNEVSWQGGNGIQATLRRPLAKLNLYNATPFQQAYPVLIQYRGVPTCYDVLTGESSLPTTLDVSFPTTTVGSSLLGEDLLFVPEQGLSLDVEVDGASKTLENLRLEANFKTNVTATFKAD